MNKRCIAALAVLIAMVVLSVFCISRAEQTVLAPVDDVEFTVLSQTGDPSAAKGLDAEIFEDAALTLRYIYSLKTDESGLKIDVRHLHGRPDSSIASTRSLYIQFDVINSNRIREYAEKEIKRRGLSAGDTFTIKVNDFYDYYPMSIWGSDTLDRLASFSVAEEDQEFSYIYKAFAEKLRVPIPQDMEITVEVDDYGSYAFHAVREDDNSVPLMFGFSGVAIGDAYYLAIYNSGYKLEGLDPVLYRIPIGKLENPYKTVKGLSTIEGPLADQMERWYVPEAPFTLSTYQSFILSEDGSVLYILSSDGDTMRVAAVTDGAERPFELDVPGIGSMNCSYLRSGSCIILYQPGKAFRCISPRESGGFVLTDFPVEKETDLLRQAYGSASSYKAAFDGERLAICGVVEREYNGQGTYLYPFYDGFFLSVYTGAGLQYSVTLHSSITDAASYPYDGDARFTSEALYINSLSWK